MKAKGRNSESTASLLVSDVPSFSLARQIQARSKKVSTVLLSRLLRQSSSKVLPQALRKQSPLTLHSSILLSQRNSAANPKTAKQSTQSKRAFHGRVLSEDVRRHSPVVTLVSEHSQEEVPRSTFQARLQDLLYNFSSQLSLIYDQKPRPALPIKTQIRHHRDYAIRLHRDRFSVQMLKRALFYAWKDYINT
jgi:hypothetical protein